MGDQRHFPDQQHRSAAVRTAAGRFAPNDTDPVDNSLNVGLGFSVERTGVGVFEVTITGKYGAFLRFGARLISSTDTFASVDMQGLPVEVDGNTVLPFLLSTLVAGVPTPTDVPPDPDTWISFDADFVEVTGRVG